MFAAVLAMTRFVIIVIVAATLISCLTAPDQAFGQTSESAQADAAEPAPKIPNDQLDSLVAPIALYPDPLLAQMLAASTYPLEIIQLEQWLKRHGNLKQDALAKEVAAQTWDPSVQALAIYPEVVTRLSENVAWTTDLGNAFLAQPSDVMSAVQRMRAKAEKKGTLKSGEQQTVETETVEGGGEIITIEPTNPQYAYVPSYDMEVVYGPPYYPYPPYYYPGYVPGMGLAFGTGIILGAAWANHWGDCDWGHGDLKVNHHNNFNKNNVNNINGGNRNQAGGGKWQHNPAHRGGAPYGDRNTAGKYGGHARQQPAGGAGNRGNRAGGGSLGSNRAGGPSGIGSGNRAGSGAGTGGLGGIGPNRADGTNAFSAANRPGADGGRGGSVGRDAFSNNVFGDRAGAGGGNRPSSGAAAGGGNRGGGTASTMPANRGGGGTQRIGERGVSYGGGFGSSNNTFGGGGFGGSSARSASNRGGHSMGGGGFSGGGGGMRGGGGGMRGGGGGRRR